MSLVIKGRNLTSGSVKGLRVFGDHVSLIHKESQDIVVYEKGDVLQIHLGRPNIPPARTCIKDRKTDHLAAISARNPQKQPNLRQSSQSQAHASVSTRMSSKKVSHRHSGKMRQHPHTGRAAIPPPPHPGGPMASSTFVNACLNSPLAAYIALSLPDGENWHLARMASFSRVALGTVGLLGRRRATRSLDLNLSARNP